jgi:hypothetical protein
MRQHLLTPALVFCVFLLGAFFALRELATSHALTTAVTTATDERIADEQHADLAPVLRIALPAPEPEPPTVLAAPALPVLTGDPLELAPEWEATEEAWLQKLESLKVDPERARELWTDPAVREAFGAIRQAGALTQWVTDYQERELERWRAHQASIPLDIELGLTLDWMLARSEDPAAMRGLIEEFSRGTIILVQEAGEDMHSRDEASPPAMWALFAGINALSTVAEAVQYLTPMLEPGATAGPGRAR